MLGRRVLTALALAVTIAGCHVGGQVDGQSADTPPLDETLRLMADAAGSHDLMSVESTSDAGKTVVVAAFKVGDRAKEYSRTNREDLVQRSTGWVGASTASFTVPIDSIDHPSLAAVAGKISCDQSRSVALRALPNGHRHVTAKCGSELTVEMLDDFAIDPLGDQRPSTLANRLREVATIVTPGDDIDGVQLWVDGDHMQGRVDMATAIGTTFTGDPCRPVLTLAGEKPALRVSCVDLPATMPLPVSALNGEVVDRIWKQGGSPVQWTLIKPSDRWILQVGGGTPDSSYALDGTPL